VNSIPACYNPATRKPLPARRGACPSERGALVDIPAEVLVLGAVVIGIAVLLLILIAWRSSRLRRAAPDRSRPTGAGADTAGEAGGTRSRPPSGRARGAVGERERLSAAFAEQIEDVLRATLLADPVLADCDIDLVTAADGSLEIIVAGETYSEVSQLPDRRIREALLKAVQEWEAGSWRGGGKS
jgi:hypothetical protein